MSLTNTSLLTLAVAATSLVGLLAPAQAFTPFDLTQTFNNPNPEVGDRFGHSVSINGTNVLVGTRYDDTGAEDAGSAYLFDTTTGNLLQTFNNPDPQTGDWFGHLVSVNGTYALMGAYWDDTGAENAGSAYLFDTVTGNILQTFNNPDPQNNDFFGWAVAVSGTNALIAAHFDDTGAENAGSVYLFDTITGNLLQTFNNPTPEIGDSFGGFMSISGSKVLIGAGLDNTGAENAGSAYLFDMGTGNLLQTFTNPNPKSGDLFGHTVSLSGTKALISSAYDSTEATDTGIAYLFDIETGNLLQTFNNPTPQSGDRFGFSASLSGTYALIGSPNDDIGATDAGSVYLFDTETGNLLQTFNNPTPQIGDLFGFSAFVSGTDIFIGALGDDTGAEDAGSAYLYQQQQQQQVPEPSTLLGAGIAFLLNIAFNRRR